MIILLTILGSFFSLAAGLTASLITGHEYLQGQKPNRRLAFWMAFKAGLIAFAVFAALTAIIGFLLIKTIG